MGCEWVWYVWDWIGFGLDRVGLNCVWFIIVRCGLGSIT